MRIAVDGGGGVVLGIGWVTSAILSGRSFLFESGVIRSDVGVSPMDSHQVV
jgi:hypothetical protein